MTTREFYNPAGDVASHVRAFNAGQVWSVSGQAFVAFVNANWMDYKITAVSDGGGNFHADVPDDADTAYLCLTGSTLAASPAVSYVTIAVAAGPGRLLAYTNTYDGHGGVAPSVAITIALQSKKTNASSFDCTPFVATSDSAGYLEVSLLKDAVYQAQRGNGRPVTFRTSVADSYALPTILGQA